MHGSRKIQTLDVFRNFQSHVFIVPRKTAGCVLTAKSWHVVFGLLFTADLPPGMGGCYILGGEYHAVDTWIPSAISTPDGRRMEFIDHIEGFHCYLLLPPFSSNGPLAFLGSISTFCLPTYLSTDFSRRRQYGMDSSCCSQWISMYRIVVLSDCPLVLPKMIESILLF